MTFNFRYGIMVGKGKLNMDSTETMKIAFERGVKKLDYCTSGIWKLSMSRGEWIIYDTIKDKVVYKALNDKELLLWIAYALELNVYTRRVRYAKWFSYLNYNKVYRNAEII